MNNPWKGETLGQLWSADPCWSNPLRNDQVDVIVEVATTARVRTVLDLGCGPGAIARRLLTEIPESEIVGIDCSAQSLRRAHVVLQQFAPRVRLIHADLEHAWHHHLQTTESFDLILAVQSLHHLTVDQRRILFQTSVAMLEPHGLIVVSDKYKVAPQFATYHNAIEEFARTRRRISAPGVSSRDELEGDILSSVSQDIHFLRECGLSSGCIWQFARRAIILGSP